MQGKKEDRRIQRTRSLLHEALLDLMIEKGYEAITIQDIIDRANVGRSTFYAHFEDKEQLLLSSISQLSEFLKEQRQSRSSNSSGEFGFGFSLAMLQHVQSHNRIYQATVGKKRGAVIQYHIQHMLAELVHEEIDDFFTDSVVTHIPKDIVVDFVVNTFLTLLTWWMDGNVPCSAKEVDRMFHTLTMSGIGSLR